MTDMTLDVVIPFYNEADCARPFVEPLLAALSGFQHLEVRAWLVDDGSSDGTALVLDDLRERDKRIRIIRLWGNHGHQKALIAGLDHCHGDVVLMLDGDGQHPVDTAVEMVRRIRDDASLDMVQAVREGAQGGALKRITSQFFYWMAKRLITDLALVPGASDFRVLRHSVLQCLQQYPDRHRNLRVLLASLKLRTAYVRYAVAPRIAGRSKYSFSKMVSLATDGWFAFSTAPLRLSLLLMCGTAFVGLSYLLYVLWQYCRGETVPGWASIIVLMMFMFSAVFAVLAILCEYVARIYADVRKHPSYRVRDVSL